MLRERVKVFFRAFEPLRLDLTPDGGEPSGLAGFSRRHAWWLFLLALALRWGFRLQYGALLLPDSWGRYLPIAEGLFGQWRGSVFDTPGYPAFLALVQRVFGGWSAAFWLQGLLDALTVVLIYAIGTRLIRPRHAFFFALFFALHAGAILFANSALSETLFTFLIVSAVFLLSRLNRNSRWPLFALPGLLLGLAAVTRANGVLILAVVSAVTALCRFKHGSLKPLACLLCLALVPIGFWVRFNHQHRGVGAIAQGGGWQWLQNMAFFQLIDPASLPPGEANRYQDWRSLTAMRTRLLQDPNREKTSLDKLCGQIARRNALKRPFTYLTTVPSAFLMPRRFIKDITRAPARPDLWRRHAVEAAANGYPDHARESRRAAPFNILYKSLRILTIIPYKYSLLILALFPATLFAWRQRNGLLLLVTGLPLGQFLVLTALLNPIERYYFPFESLMLLAALVTIAKFKERPRDSNGSKAPNLP